jgi:hypothetical protein
MFQFNLNDKVIVSPPRDIYDSSYTAEVLGREMSVGQEYYIVSPFLWDSTHILKIKELSLNDNSETVDLSSYSEKNGGWIQGVYLKINTEQASSGVVCKKCFTHNEYAGPNMSDGTYLCYNCRV